MPTLEGLAADLAAGHTTSRTLLEACLERIEAAGSDGRPNFIELDRAGAEAAADAMDRLRAAGAEPSRFAGIPISIKDLFDIRGQVTRAGSIVLADEAPAKADAVAVARVRQAGFVFVGRTNMTEFAFSGLGLNPHYGTPLGPWDVAGRRVAGGSTSGGAASVAAGMAHATLGTDTGGSCRIPAAWCGLTGFKPTAARVPKGGSVDLSTTLDSVGSIARSVRCCRVIDGILTGTESEPTASADLAALRFLAPTNFVLNGMDEAVAASWERALTRLSDAGASIECRVLAGIDSIPSINAKGGFAAAESWALHRARILAGKGEAYDPRVLKRIMRGGEQEAADYIDLIAVRGDLIRTVARDLAGFDAILMPTTPIVPPRLAEMTADADYDRINLLALRNPSVVNMLDGCAISLPMHADGEAPAGLMIAGIAGQDERIFAIASAVESLFRLS